MTDLNAHRAVMAAAYATALGQWDVFEFGATPGLDGNPGTEPLIYGLLDVTREVNSFHRLGGVGTARLYRVTARAVASTPGEVRWALERATEAFEDVAFKVGEHDTTPLEFADQDDPNRDKDRYFADVEFTYAVAH